MENKIKISTLASEVITILTTVFPLALSMAACCGLNPAVGVVGAIVAALLIKVSAIQKIMPILTSFAVFSFVVSAYGIGTAILSVLTCGILLVITAFLGPDFKYLIFRPAVTAIMTATAISITVLQTTNYFGIGATGNDIAEMLASYVSLGFHPNWRGVLYGTVVLVLLITYPKKFKNLESKIRAPFIALIFTLILNLILNPIESQSAINEIGAFSFAPSEILFQIKNFEFSVPSLGAGIICGAAIYIPTVYSIFDKDSSNEDYLAAGISNIISSFFGVFLPCKIKTKKDFNASGIISAILILVISLLLKDYIARIPLHSCAVVLIVAAWQSMKWKFFKSIFNDVASVACFLTTLAFSLLFGIAGGILFGAAFSCFCRLLPNLSKINLNK